MKTSDDRQLEAFLFDLDGTIIDSSQPQLHALARLLKEEGSYPGSDDALHRFIGVPSEQVMAEILAGADHASLLRRLGEYERELYHELSVHNGILEVLNRIKQLDLPIAIVTSQVDHELADTRKRINLERWISVWVTADDVPRPKPDPGPIHLALEKLGYQPNQAIMIGDTVYDIQAGARAGTQTGAALWGSVVPEALEAEKPDYVFKRPQEIIEQLLSA